MRFIDADGMKPDDFALLIAKDGAGGQGHMAAVIQDGKGNYFYVTMGAAENASVSKMASGGVQGGMNMQPLTGAKSMTDAINMAKQDKNNSQYTDQVVFKTNSETDKKIFKEVSDTKDKVNSGEKPYNVVSNNCTDAVEKPITEATGVSLPDNPIPNNNFKSVKDNQNNIQTSIGLREGTSKVEFNPSGLDNVPTSTRPRVVPNDKKEQK